MSQVTLSFLKATIPAWHWEAERCGFGWEYVGFSGEDSVRVTAHCRLCGPTDDDFLTEWRVSKPDGSTESFNSWAFEAF